MTGAYATDMLNTMNEEIYRMVQECYDSAVRHGAKPEVAGEQADSFMVYLFKARRVQREAQARQLAAVPA